MHFGGTLARTVIAQIVFVHAIDDVRIAAFSRERLQPNEQLILAVKAAVFIVLDVIGIFEFVSIDVLVPEPAFASEGFGIALMRGRDGGRISRDGDRVSPVRAVRPTPDRRNPFRRSRRQSRARVR